MLSRLSFVILFTAAIAALPGVARAQSITRVTPEVASVGDTVILTGTNLQNTTQVRFFATVGGFIGVWTANVMPSSVSATRVTAIVPQMAAFAPPGASPPGIPVGTVRTIGPAASNELPFYFLQATPSVTTVGTGTTQPGAIGKPVVGFTIAGGAPESPNPSFVLTLENAIPGTVAALLLGLPGTPPYPMIGDGTFVLDPFTQVIVLPPLPVDAQGDIKLPAAIPAGVTSVTASIQWLVVQGPSLYLSNGLTVAF